MIRSLELIVKPLIAIVFSAMLVLAESWTAAMIEGVVSNVATSSVGVCDGAISSKVLSTVLTSEVAILLASMVRSGTSSEVSVTEIIVTTNVVSSVGVCIGTISNRVLSTVLTSEVGIIVDSEAQSEPSTEVSMIEGNVSTEVISAAGVSVGTASRRVLSIK